MIRRSSIGDDRRRDGGGAIPCCPRQRDGGGAIPCRRWSPLALVSGCVLLACSSQSRVATLLDVSETNTDRDRAASMVVPYPPPPAKVETIPPAPPNPSCVYLDGQWLFGARDWQWSAGAWVIPQSGCVFAQARVFWEATGADRSELRFRPGHWVREDHPDVDCAPATTCPGTFVVSTP